MKIAWLALVTFLGAQTLYPVALQPTLRCNHHKNTTYTLTVILPISAPQIVYRDYVTLSIDHPDVTLTPWKATPESVTIFDKHFKKDKHVFTQSVIITCQAHISHPIMSPVHLHLSYVTGPRIDVHHTMLPCALDYAARSDTPQAEPTHLAQSPSPSAPRDDTPNDTDQLSSPDDAPTPATDCSGPGCMIMGIIVLLAGLLLLNKADQEDSESSLHGGIITIIIAVLIMVHGHHALQINTHNATTQNQTHSSDPMNVYQT